MHQQNLIDERLFEWSDLKWKPGIVTRVVAGLIGHSRARQASTRSDETIDAPPRPLTPADIEGSKLREELQLAVGEMVVDPPRHRPPIHAGRIMVGEPWHHDRSHRADAALGIATVPDVAPVIAFV
jgi:hypothetical protein